MAHITPQSLMTLEAYQKIRSALRTEILAHKKQRTIHLGEHITFIFEDEYLIRYQVQEMLRIEKVFDEAGIQNELSAYNPLIPDGSNFKATVMIAYPDEQERHIALAKLVNIEHHFFIKIDSYPAIYAFADEDLPRSTEHKTSAVHFLRFELTAEIKDSLQIDTPMYIGCDHPMYSMQTAPFPKIIMTALLKDLDKKN